MKIKKATILAIIGISLVLLSLVLTTFLSYDDTKFAIFTGYVIDSIVNFRILSFEQFEYFFHFEQHGQHMFYRNLYKFALILRSIGHSFLLIYFIFLFEKQKK